MDAALFAFDNSYARLPERFYARLAPTPVSDAHLVRVTLNSRAIYAWSPISSPLRWGSIFSPATGFRQEPSRWQWPTRGSSFGGCAPQLGDGRAILLAR
jgi:uncharacterized protein YdiU (UPF0061 family)